MLVILHLIFFLLVATCAPPSAAFFPGTKYLLSESGCIVKLETITVKHIYSGHHWELKIVSIIERCSQRRRYNV